MSALAPLLAHVIDGLSRTRPLFVALQGPQGSGKSYTSNLLVEQLRSRSLNVALLSLDDLYLPHSGLVKLARDNPTNTLWQGRGQPGTHDVSLGMEVLSRVKAGAASVELPRFEKSLFDGEGDRLPLGSGGAVVVHPPVDIVVIEGWCVGFYPISPTEIDARWDGSWKKESTRLGLSVDFIKKEDMLRVNEALKEYVPMWNLFDIFIQLQPFSSTCDLSSPLSVIYKWRLEQEHYMKDRNGGLGMSDAAVKTFVDRYIPGYVFFGDGPQLGFGEDKPSWLGKSLRILIDERRLVVQTQSF